jgi:quercetin dioxygenase-like cupin family protein
MNVVRFEELALDTVEQEAGARWRAAFPFSPDRPGETTGDAADCTVVYNELDPGSRIGRHRDGSEELLFVLSGTVEASVDGTTATVDAGSLAVIPAGEPHAVTNVGSTPARLIGVFGSTTVDSAFESDPTVVDGADGADDR